MTNDLQPPDVRHALPRTVHLIALAYAALLTVFSNGYGFHRDELYFRMLPPDWGYLDQPGLTPLLARVFTTIADEPWALRIPATLAAVASLYCYTLITRELGGSRAAQILCAAIYAVSGIPLIEGHVLLTATIDLPLWGLVILFVLRTVTRSPRWWLAAGLVGGMSTYNRYLVVALVGCLLVGLLVTGPRRTVFTGRLPAAALIAAVVGLPNLIYQATQGWPQATVARGLSAANAAEVRVNMWWFLLVMISPVLVPLLIGGGRWLAARPWARFLLVAFAAMLVFTFWMGSQMYYPFGLLAVLLSAGVIPALEWARTRARRILGAVLIGVAGLVNIVIGLPVMPAEVNPARFANQIMQDSVGWPRYIEQIAQVYRTLPADDQQQAIVLTSNYGEAGAVARYGPALGLPAAYSGHNALFAYPPPVDRTVAVVVGTDPARVGPLFASCLPAARLDNGLDVDNEEQGEEILICRDPVGGWPAIWPRLRTVN